MKSNRNHMKKTLLLTLALGLAGATSLVAGTIDVFITGSTAFRANVYAACSEPVQSSPSGTALYLCRHGARRRRFRLQPQNGFLGHDRHADHRAYEHSKATP